MTKLVPWDVRNDRHRSGSFTCAFSPGHLALQAAARTQHLHVASLDRPSKIKLRGGNTGQGFRSPANTNPANREAGDPILPAKGWIESSSNGADSSARTLQPISSVHPTTQQQVASDVHRLHGVVPTAAVGVVVGGGEFPGPGHIRLPQTAGQGQPQALSGDDRIEIGGFAEGRAIGGTEATAPFAAAVGSAALLRPEGAGLAAPASGSGTPTGSAPKAPLCGAVLLCAAPGIGGGVRIGGDAAQHQGGDRSGCGGHRRWWADSQPAPSPAAG